MLLRREKDSKQSDEIQARLQHYYPKNFRCNFTFYESENFSIFLSPLLHYIFESKNFRGLFYTKNSPAIIGEWNVKNCRKCIRQGTKIVCEWNGHLESFSCPKPIYRKFYAMFAFPNRYLTENSHWVPLTVSCNFTYINTCLETR